MRLNELYKNPLDKKTLDLKELSRKHNVSVEVLKKQLKKGIAVEQEHTSDKSVAREIALDHLAEMPDYYDKLDTIEK